MIDFYLVNEKIINCSPVGGGNGDLLTDGVYYNSRKEALESIKETANNQLKEVACYKLRYSDGSVEYYVLPWEDNDLTSSDNAHYGGYFDTEYTIKIETQYHFGPDIKGAPSFGSCDDAIMACNANCNVYHIGSKNTYYFPPGIGAGIVAGYTGGKGFFCSTTISFYNGFDFGFGPIIGPIAIRNEYSKMKLWK